MFNDSCKKRTSLLLILLAFLASSISLAQPPHIKKMLEQKGKKIPSAPVVIAPVVKNVVQGHTWYSGNLVSRNVATLSPESDGKILYIAEAGEHFKIGDVLVQLDDTLLTIVLTENKASVKNYSAQVDFLKRETYRFSQLLKKGNVSRSNYEESQYKLKSAQAQLEAAKARTKLNQEQIARMKIKAPFDGVVSNRYTTKGEWVQSGNNVMDFINLKQLEIVVRISAKDFPYVQVNDTLTISLDSNKAQLNTAQIRSIVPASDAQSRLFELRLIPPLEFGLIGQLVQIAIPNSQNQAVLLVPEDALVIRGDSISVFKLSSKMNAVRVPVKVGISKDGMIVINNNKLLRVGDKVIIRGNERLFDGMPVRETKLPAQQ